MTQHTKTPWHYEGGTSIYKMNGTCHEIARASVPATSNECEEANAEFIVRACNAHDDLVSALNAMLEAYAEEVGDLNSPKYNAVHQAALVIDRLEQEAKAKAVQS